MTGPDMWHYLLAGLAALLSMMSGIVSWFVVRLVAKVDKQLDKHAEMLQEHDRAIIRLQAAGEAR